MLAGLPVIAILAALIEFGGAIIIAIAVVRSLLTLVGEGGIAGARRQVIAGTLSALGFKTAATLLKVIELGTWQSIGVFAAIFTLRSIVKQLFVWEQTRLTADAAPLPIAA